MYEVEGLTPDLHREILEYLSFRFSRDALAVVDQTVYNPSRIWKVYGTLSRKGENSEDRPWRVSHLISKDSPKKVVQQQQLQELLADSPKENKRDVLAPEDREALTTWMGTHFPSAGSFVPWQDKGRKWVFDVCPWNPAHTDRSAYVLQFNNGAIVAGCLHKNCKGHQKDEDGSGTGWQKLQELAGEGFGGGGDKKPKPSREATRNVCSTPSGLVYVTLRLTTHGISTTTLGGGLILTGPSNAVQSRRSV